MTNDNGELKARLAEISALKRVDGTGEAHPEGSYILFAVMPKGSETMRFRYSINGCEVLQDELASILTRPDSRDKGLIDNLDEVKTLEIMREHCILQLSVSGLSEETITIFAKQRDALTRAITALSQASEPAKPKAEDFELPEMVGTLGAMSDQDKKVIRAYATAAIRLNSKAMGGGNE